MFVLHAHWEAPRAPAEKGGVLFWAETSDGNPPPWQRGRLSQSPRPKAHPFCAPWTAVQRFLNQAGDERTTILRLPTTRSGPQPSPTLVHTWQLDEETPPFLAPWIISGLWLSPVEAFQVLLDPPSSLVSDEPDGRSQVLSLVLGSDVHYWHRVCGLCLETLAAQKIVPVLESIDGARKTYHARWLPVLDGPKDGPRLVQLESAMPPLCRAGAASLPASSRLPAASPSGDDPSPRRLLTTFIHTMCDALARQWGKAARPRLPSYRADPAYRWLDALFADEPAVQASPAQLTMLASSQRAWMRNLYVAGDAAYRIAFRLTAHDQPGDKPNWQLHYLLQARDDPSLLVSAETVWGQSADVLSQVGHRFEQPQERLLAGLGYAARLFPPLTQSLKSKRPTHLALDTPAAYTFLRETAPLLEGAGFGLLVPPWWNQRGARLGVRLRVKGQQGVVASGRMSLENIIAYQWEMSLGETTLTEQEFLSLAALKSPLVQIRGQWVQLDAEQVEAAIQFWEKQQTSGEMSLLEAIQYSLGGQTSQADLPIDEVVAEGWLADWLERFKQSERLEQLSQPTTLHGQLRPYQIYGYSWLHFFRRWGLGVCLADDMGLGKTIQTIALLLREKEDLGSLPAPSLLVCPTSVVTNWEREIRRFAPSLTTLLHQGASRLRGEAFRAAALSVDLVLTSYALARQDANMMQTVDWLGVILDEAQNIKNPSARQSQAVRKLHSDFRLTLTGTPVENRLSELWSIMHFLNPGYLGTREKFRSDFAIPIERYQDEAALARLKQLTGPLILRRLKTDSRVIQDLPAKVETKVYCYLTEEQATLYEAVVQDAMVQIEQHDQGAAGDGIQRRGQVLSMLMQLKQICNHPIQYLHQSGKDGSAGLEMAGRSGKLERLLELLEEVLAEGDRALIFTQFAEMGQLLAGYLPQAVGVAVQLLHGGTPAKVRDQMVRRFQEDERAPAIFILSLKAGGTGLNLTRANHVFHFDRWWNPAVEDQATDRAFRIGQKRNVQVHKFVTTGTLEEMIDDMIESKKDLAQSVLGSGENWLTELNTADLRKLVQLRRD
jgi:superfamily II DNA or RNA helicase